jgi:hypothetical protein
VKYYLLKPFNAEHAVAVFRRAAEKKPVAMSQLEVATSLPSGQRDDR